MRKFLLLSTMVLVALLASAQNKIAPKLQKGDRKVYNFEMIINGAGQKELKLSTVEEITVAEQQADGYVLELVTTSVKSDAAGDAMNRIVALSQELVANARIRLLTDKDGRPLKLLNFNEVKQKCEATTGKLIDELLANVPEVKSIGNKDVLMKQLQSNITEEALLKSMNATTNPLALNGKTISMGAQDEYVDETGLKIKRMFFPAADGTVTVTSSLNMNKDEIKQLIISQVEKIAPAQAEMVKQNIDMILQTDAVKVDMTEKATYTFAPDGWVKTITAEKNNESMGQKISQKATITLQ